MATIPRIDPNVRHISIGQLRKEKDFKDTLVVSDGPLPVAVVVPYAVFLEMQRALEAAYTARVESAAMGLPMPGPGIPIVQGGPVTAGHKPDPSSPLRGV